MPTEKRARHKAARREKLAQQQKETKRRQLLRRSAWVVAITAVVIGSVWGLTGSSPSTPSTTTKATTSTGGSTTTTTATGSATTQAAANALAVSAGCPAKPTTHANNLQWSSAPPMTINTMSTYYAHFETTAGSFTVALNPKVAPQTVNNFVFLASHEYYDCVIFHRVIPGFMLQGGDPTGTGMGSPGYTIADEFPTKTANAAVQYPLYSIAMANTGAAHSGGSQFFIITGAEGEALQNRYSLFGSLINGTETAMKINNDGDPNANDGTGTALKITHRILHVTISTTPPTN